jgi:hypothetical protein
VADGGLIPWTDDDKDWFSQHIRFVAFVSAGSKGSETPFADSTPQSWTLCIVGSNELESQRRFLQVASWDGKAFRFYGVGSTTAFYTQTDRFA